MSSQVSEGTDEDSMATALPCSPSNTIQLAPTSRLSGLIHPRSAASRGLIGRPHSL